MDEFDQVHAEQEMVRAAIRSLLEAQWPSERAVKAANDPAKVAKIWRELVAQGFGDIGLDREAGPLGLGIIVAEELGRAACPAPLMPAIVANYLASNTPVAISGEDDRSQPLAVVFGSFDGDPLAGTAAWTGSALEGTARFVEHLANAHRLLVLLPDGYCTLPAGDNGVSCSAAPGLSVPPLGQVEFQGAPASFVPVDREALCDAAAIARLLLAARAAGALQRNFEMVTEHVSERIQFGRRLATFQSMQHKLADCALALDASRMLIAVAAKAFDAGHPAWPLQSDLAIAFASTHLRKISMEIQHAFGATGYAEEHEAPRHFRRAHADLSRMGGQRRARAAIAAAMVEGESHSLPERELGDDVADFRREIRDWLAENWTEADRQEQRSRPFHERGLSHDFARRLGRAGWLSLMWPRTAGGAGASASKQLVLLEELLKSDAPTSHVVAAAWLVAPEIIRHGTDWQKKELLPKIAAGELSFALGYSEPEAGSDLGSLRTRAVRDGDNYVITGQKLWGTHTDHATHILLAARTDQEAKPRSSGISLFIVPTDLPGITIQPSMALYGFTFCTQFFDEVRIPAEYRLGEENGGWAVLTGALASERIQMGAFVTAFQNLYERLCGFVAERSDLRDDAWVRDTLGRFGAEIEAARQLSLRSVQMLDAGRMPVTEGAMTKIFSGNLAEEFAQGAMDILGMAGTLSEEALDVPLDGLVEWSLRRSIMLVIGGGAAEIQKTIIAQRGLGLPSK
jgi:3-oxo-4-pregnene-20-carboxyl-CoA dehydrogenase beta subunit